MMGVFARVHPLAVYTAAWGAVEGPAQGVQAFADGLARHGVFAVPEAADESLRRAVDFMAQQTAWSGRIMLDQMWLRWSRFTE